MRALLIDAAQLLAPWHHFLSTAYAATLLVIFGQSLNRKARHWMRRLHFVLRTALFVILCAVGYGYLTVQGGQWLTQLVAWIEPEFQAPAIIGAFLWAGWYAERHSV